MSLTKLLHAFTAKPDEKPAAREQRKPEALEALNIEGNSEGLWHWDLLRNKLRVSKGWAAILGWDPDDLGDRPRDWFSLIHPYYVGGVRMDLAAHLKGQKDQFECEYRIRHRNGTYRWVLCRGRAVRDKRGNAVEISGVQTDVTRLIEVENRLVEDALHDRLTGLPNRNFFQARLDQAVEEQRRDQRLRFAVLFLDLDRFKDINDSLGHMLGDELLTSTSKRLRECVGPDDFVARFGGDEFVILLERTRERNEAEEMALRIQKSLEFPFLLDGHQVVVNASVGIVVSDPNLYSAEELIRNADIAMYQAKTEGKAKSKVFTPVMSKKIERSWKLENDLRRAIARNELTVAYQPQICPRSGKILGAEALLRWTREDGQIISPAEFIPLAEKSDLILQIGEWVLMQACKEAVRWAEFTGESANAVKISVNISGRQLLQPEFPSLLESIVRDTGLDPRTLELELTESVLVDSMKKTPAVLGQLSRLGTKLAIDDFGTGYSSMRYLRDLMPDVIKIDRSFVAGVGRERSAGALAKGMIGLAHDLGLTVIAEGVEDNLQLSFLQRHDCDLVQGYLASRPIPPEALRALLRENRSLISTASSYTLGGATDSDHEPVLVA